MSKASTARWKNCERGIAKLLNKYLIPAERVSRSGNYNVSDFDVKIDGFHEAKIDGKYSIRSFKTSHMLDIVKDKYCRLRSDIPILFCKGFKERGYKTTVEGEHYAMLLAYWLGKGTREELLAIYNKETIVEADDE